MTAATRKAAERQRKEAAGLVRVEVWVPAEDAPVIRRVAERLMRTPLRNTKMRDELKFGSDWVVGDRT